MNRGRRTVVTLGLAAAAGAAGVGASWWRYRTAPVLSDAEAAFWALDFEDPAGRPLAMASFRGRPLLLNFWATWCPPCVEELPMLNAFFEAHRARGWQVVGLAVDRPSAVQSFLQRLPLVFPVGMAGLAGTDLSRSLGNMSGALPFSVVFDASGSVAHRKLGKVSQGDLELWSRLG